MKFESSAVVSRGRVTVDVSQWHTAGDGLAVWVTVEELGTTRSKRANAYYWSTVVAMIAKETGHTSEAVHDALCAMFLPNTAAEVAFFAKLTGERLAVKTDGRRSSKLSKSAFYDFVEQARAWAGEFLGLVIPDPDPDYWRKSSAK